MGTNNDSKIDMKVMADVTSAGRKNDKNEAKKVYKKICTWKYAQIKKIEKKDEKKVENN